VSTVLFLEDLVGERYPALDDTLGRGADVALAISLLALYPALNLAFIFETLTVSGVSMTALLFACSGLEAAWRTSGGVSHTGDA
jgi:hypothetical protein